MVLLSTGAGWAALRGLAAAGLAGVAREPIPATGRNSGRALADGVVATATWGSTAVPVSYTHLDVYKRQP